MTSSNSVTNLDYLHSLAKGDTGFITEMITIFLTDTPGEIEMLKKAIDETDYENIQAMAHHIRSTLPFVGLDLIIGKDIVDIEKLAEEKTGIQNIRNMFKHVYDVCEKAYAELKQK